MCGDRVRIEVEISESTIRAAAFTANACAICTASASLLTERLTGMPVDRAAEISDTEMHAALGTDVPQARIVCATLPVRTLREALRRLHSPS